MPPSSNPLLIGITGNIGSGKTLVCRYIAEQGYNIVYADIIAKQQLSNPYLILKIKESFPESLNSDNSINKSKLAELVFSEPSLLARLNQIVHPLVLEELNKIVRDSNQKVLFFEIPLLFEVGLQKCFDAIILVTANQQLRMERVCRRDSTDARQVLQRMQAQLPDDDKVTLVDYIIDNNGDPEDLSQKVRDVLTNISLLSPRAKIPFSKSHN